MATRQAANAVTLSDSADLIRLKATIQEPGSSSLVVEVHAGSEVSIDPADIAELAQLARSHEVDLAIESDDPILEELAQIYGVSNVPDRSLTRRIRAMSSEQPTVKGPLATDPPGQAGQHSDATRVAVKSDDASGPGKFPTLPPGERVSPFPDDASFSFVIRPPVPRRPDLNDLYGQSSVDTSEVAEYVQRSQAQRRKRSGLIALISFVVCGVTLALLLAIFMPYTKVAIVPASAPVETEITYGVSTDPGAYDLVLQPQNISTDVSVENSIPTTGERFQPDGTASGSILFTNASTAELSVPAGTVLSGPGAVDFLTLADVVIPAADPFGALTLGSATVGVEANAAGVEGNLDAGALAGQLAANIFFTNRETMSGGSVIRIPIVSEEDVVTLREQLATGITNQADSALVGAAGAGQKVLSGSVSQSDISYSLNHAAGEDAETITGTASAQLSAQSYSPEQLEQAGHEAVAARLADAVPQDQVLLAHSISIGESQPLAANDMSAFTLSAVGQSRNIIDDDTLDKLKRQLVGADSNQAREMLSGMDGVASFELQQGPDWLPIDLAPRLESRIAVTIDEDVAQDASPQATGP